MANADTGEAPLPFFVAAPGQIDPLMIGMIMLLLGAVLGIGIFYLHLHSLPERMAHRANSTQLQLVGILTLIALFTHNHLFWIAALLLVAVQFPDFITPLQSIARSLTKMAGQPNEAVDPPPDTGPDQPADIPIAAGENPKKNA